MLLMFITAHSLPLGSPWEHGRPQLYSRFQAFEMGVDQSLPWDRLSTFDRVVFLRSLLDGTASEAEVNYSVWRGLGLVSKDSAVPLSSCGTSGLPDIFSDAALLAYLEAQLPKEDEDAMSTLDMVIETLHGEALTRQLLRQGDANFAVRRIAVCWLYSTQKDVSL